MTADATFLERTAVDYDTLLARAVFRPFAGRVVAELPPVAGLRILDVACGTGALTQELAAQAGAEGNVHGLDANPGMLAVARRNAPTVDWHLGEAAALPFADGSFDLVTCQFALMLFEDRAAALREMWRVLSPGGTLAFVLFESLSANRGYARIAEVYERHAGAEVAGALRVPFSLGESAEVEALIEEAGLPKAERCRLTITARFGSAGDLARSDIEGWFPFAGLSVTDEARERIVADLAAAFGDAGPAFDVHATLYRTRR